MVSAKQKTQSAAVDLSSEAFGGYGDFSPTYSRQQLLDNGVLINVTAWIHREMGLGKKDCRLRVHAAVSAKLWRALHEIPSEIRFFQTVRGRGHDVLWIASWALRKAEKAGQDYLLFQAVLPTDENDADCKTLRVESAVDEEGRRHVTVGFPEEFPIL